MKPQGIAELNTSFEPRLLDRLARRLVIRQLESLRGGEITFEAKAGSVRLGQAADLNVVVRVHRPRFFRDALLGGTLSVADSYLRGDWDCDDLTSLFRIFVRNLKTTNQIDGGFARFGKGVNRLYHGLHGNSRSGSRRNIRAHYDLGNDFFKVWLDETMTYSSGIFPGPSATLNEASLEKIDRACRKLDLQPDDHLLEIGSGWGALAIHAARNYHCRVTTTTISREQFECVKTRIESEGLTDRISLLQHDYRDLKGQFDKLVSIEMVEAVGHKYLDTYFRKCGELLRPAGSMVLQAIVMPERHYAQYLRDVDFIQRHIFPGGSLPSLSAMLESAGRATDLRFVHAEDFAPHYARTLRHWHRSFSQRLDEVRRLGYPDEFVRLWTYYLSYCEAAFEERYIGVLQIQFDKPQCRRDPILISRQAAASQERPQSHTESAADLNQKLCMQDRL